MKKNILAGLIILATLAGCQIKEKEIPLKKDYVFQIKNVGMPRDVFLRRFTLTQYYSKADSFPLPYLKKIIRERFLNDYLLIQYAYDKKMNEWPEVKQNFDFYKQTILLQNHPIHFRTLNIPKQKLKAYYEKFRTLYDIELVESLSYDEAAQIRENWLKGDLGNLKDRPKNFFPRYLKMEKIVFGNLLHPELFSVIETLKEGEISKPVFTTNTWALIKVNKIRHLKHLRPFEENKNTALKAGSDYFKFLQVKHYVDSLRNAIQIEVDSSLIPLLAKSFDPKETRLIDQSKIKQSELRKPFIRLGETSYLLKDFIAFFNKKTAINPLPTLSEPDVKAYVTIFIDERLLYNDALKHGLDKKEPVKTILEDKEHRLLLSACLKHEVAKKIDPVTEEEIKQYYLEHKNEYQNTSLDRVERFIRQALHSQKLVKRRDALIQELAQKYPIRYNDALLVQIGQILTKEKNKSK